MRLLERLNQIESMWFLRRPGVADHDDFAGLPAERRCDHHCTKHSKAQPQYHCLSHLASPLPCCDGTTTAVASSRAWSPTKRNKFATKRNRSPRKTLSVASTGTSPSKKVIPSSRKSGAPRGTSSSRASTAVATIGVIHRSSRSKRKPNVRSSKS